MSNDRDFLGKGLRFPVSVNLNGGGGTPTAAPFGGVKQSGFGSMGGRFGLQDFLRPKNVYIPLG